jgi:hypothetical protein
MSTLLSISITFATLIAALATLITVLCTGMFTQRPPQGPDAMGLIVPLSTAAAAVLGFLAAGALAGSRGALDWLLTSRAVGSLILGFAGLLVGGAVLGALVGWSEKHPWGNVITLNFIGVLLPALFLVFLLSSAWVDLPRLRGGGFKALSLAAASAPAVGVVIALIGLKGYVQMQAYRNVAVAQEMAKQAAEESRRAALTPEQRLLEDLSHYSPTQPLWTLVAGLPEEQSASLRAIWMERALQHPDFENELRSTMTCDYAVYRHGCVILLIEMPADRIKPATYAQLLASDARQTASAIREGGLARRDENDFSQHAAHIALAAQRVTLTDELRDALDELRSAVEHPATATAK